jgi:hypothetical protein
MFSLLKTQNLESIMITLRNVHDILLQKFKTHMITFQQLDSFQINLHQTLDQQLRDLYFSLYIKMPFLISNSQQERMYNYPN